MAGQGQGANSKGNGASKRMQNEHLKAKRARCWANSQKRKERNRKANEAAHAANVARGITGHGLAKQRRQERRASERQAA